MRSVGIVITSCSGHLGSISFSTAQALATVALGRRGFKKLILEARLPVSPRTDLDRRGQPRGTLGVKRFVDRLDRVENSVEVPFDIRTVGMELCLQSGPTDDLVRA